MTDLPDAKTAWEAWNVHENFGLIREAVFKAGFAAASGPWAEQLDAPLRADHPAIVSAQKEGHENGWNAAGSALRDMADELERSRAECKHLNDRLDEAGEFIATRTAERDAALARNAELQAEKERWRTRAKSAQNELSDIRTTIGSGPEKWTEADSISVYRTRAEDAEATATALRAELDNLRDRLTALADETGSAFPYVQVRELRAIVRGSDDE